MTSDDIKNIKKVELHIHLDGSVDVDLASKLSNKDINTVKDKMMVDKNCKDLNDYLTKFDFPVSLMQTKENLISISSKLADYLVSQNVIYSEVRFAPAKHLSECLTMDEVVSYVLEGLQSKKNIKINLLLCMMRGDTFEINRDVVNTAFRFKNKGVCGIDLAGAESLYPVEDYTKLFMIARNLNIPYTIHAGEAASDKSVYNAIKLGAKRLGHGVRAIENLDVVDLVKEKNVFLEVCPTSNLQTCVVDNYKKHPIKKLFDMGVLLNINTDNKTVSNITLNDEYYNIYKAFKFSKDDFNKMNIDAINASFISEDEKKELVNIIKKG